MQEGGPWAWEREGEKDRIRVLKKKSTKMCLNLFPTFHSFPTQAFFSSSIRQQLYILLTFCSISYSISSKRTHATTCSQTRPVSSCPPHLAKAFFKPDQLVYMYDRWWFYTREHAGMWKYWRNSAKQSSPVQSCHISKLADLDIVYGAYNAGRGKKKHTHSSHPKHWIMTFCQWLIIIFPFVLLLCINIATLLAFLS